jgi:exodeoxyribonuclease VII large subunit
VLRHRIETLLSRLQAQLTTQTQVLNTVSPLATLERGYAIVTRADGSVLQDAAEVQSGDEIEARLKRGSVRARIT